MATYPSRGQRAPNYWDQQLKDYIDEAVAGAGGGGSSASDFAVQQSAFDVDTSHTMAFGSVDSSNWKRYVVTSASPGDLPLDFGRWTMEYQSSDTSIAPVAPQPDDAWYTVRTITNGAQLDLFGKNGGNRSAWVWVDGRPLTDAPVSAGSAAGNIDLHLTFSASAPQGRLVEIHTDLDEIFNIATYGVSASPAAADCWAPVSNQPVLAALGDSYFTTVMDPSGATMSNGYGMWQVMWRLLGLPDVPYNGYGGSGFLADPAGDGSSKFSARLHYITDLNPDVAVIKDSGNDYDVTTDVQTHITAITSLFGTLRAALPDAKLVFGESWFQPSGVNYTTERQAGIAVFNAALSALAPYNVYFIDCQTPDQWITGTGSTGGTDATGNADLFIGGDWVHPSPAGHEYLSGRMADKLRQVLRDDGSLVNTVI